MSGDAAAVVGIYWYSVTSLVTTIQELECGVMHFLDISKKCVDEACRS